MRCGSAIVSERATKFEVLQKCGEPALVEEIMIYDTIPFDSSSGWRRIERHEVPYHQVPIQPGDSTFPYALPPGYKLVAPPQIVEDWTYNFGPNRFVYRLRFSQGVLLEISTRGYGY